MDSSLEEDLTQDLMSIITVFSARYNGMRRYHKKKDSGSNDETNDGTKENPETMDGDSRLIYPSIGSSKKRRKDKLSITEKQIGSKEKHKRKRRVDEESS